MSESTSTKQTMDYLPDVPAGRSCLGDPQSLSRDSGNEKNPTAAENVENSSVSPSESGREFIDNIKVSHHRSTTNSFQYTVFKPDETFPQRILEQITIQSETRKLYDWPGSNPYRLKFTGNCIFITHTSSHVSRNL